VVDIYMPDMKYADEAIARKYSGVADYPAINQAAVREMQRQVGDLLLDERGLAQRGLLVRHLILPNDLAGTQAILRFLAQHISRQVYLNLMDQYRPAYRAGEYPELNRPISRQEHHRALALAQELGLQRLDQRRGWGW
jgi:putative pyruvate formate lyase activating enzyme